MNEYRKKIDEVRELLKPPHLRKKSPSILLGSSSGKPFYLTGKDLEHSIHIMGASREGKSKQIQNIFRQFLMQGIGGCVIDPHGYLYDDLVADCSYLSSRYPEILDRIIMFDPGSNEHIVGLNTLQHIDDLDLEMQTLSRMYATLKGRGKDNFDDFPTAKVWLQNIFTPLIEKGLTLVEVKYLIDRKAKTSKIAQTIVKGTSVDLIEHDWEWLMDASKKIQYEELLSSVNMLRNFVTSKRLELIFGRQKKVIDLRQAMDQGKIILVNLRQGMLHKDISRLLGTLLVNEFFLAAMTRTEESRPFFVAIDEFENYVTQDISDILDQGLKFGLRLILAHHSLTQVREENKKVLAAVMQNAKLKIIYGGLTYEDAEILAKDMFTHAGSGGLDPMKIKRIQKSPYTETHESTRTVTGKTESRGDFSGKGSADGFAFQSGQTAIPLDSLFLADKVISQVSSYANQHSDMNSAGTSFSDSLSEVIVPFVEQELKWYVSNIQYMPLDEQLYSIVAKLKNLPQQICMVKLPKKPVHTIKTNYVEKYYRLENEVEEFASAVNKDSPYHMTPAEAKNERERITSELRALSVPPEIEIEPDEDRFQ